MNHTGWPTVAFRLLSAPGEMEKPVTLPSGSALVEILISLPQLGSKQHLRILYFCGWLTFSFSTVTVLKLLSIPQTSHLSPFYHFPASFSK